MKPTEPFKYDCSGRYHLFVPFLKAELEQSIPDRFEQQASLHPRRTAIAGRGKLLSYNDLNRRANQIAWTLLDLCADAQRRIALLLEEGDLIGAILGVLKAGQVYVPLDSSAPKTRNQFILQDAEASFMLTNNRNFALATELARDGVCVINVDNLGANLPVNNLGLSISPDAIAYIIYTSGSTGQPKGVIETHRNLLHNVMTNTNTLRISCEDRVSLLRSVGAAGAARDALSALLNGAALCPFSVKESGLQALTGWLMSEEITILTTIITVFRHLGAILSDNERFPSVRIIYVGGEQVTQRDVELYKKYFSDDCLFVNRLGITETGTIAYFFVDKNTRFSGTGVPVGYPAEDTEVLILDENGNEMGDDCIGEIAIKSEYISPGYWKCPEITRSVFFPDPSGGNKRIYRTGDLGRKLSDGCLVHLGWKDFQVNIRGYRIAVVEVEAELLNHPGVLETVVVGREHPSGEFRLVAAVVPRQKDVVSAETLRHFLSTRIPDYMIPAAFMILDSLSLGPNGKIDRRALSTPEWLPPTHTKKIVGPRTELEEVILGIWIAILDLDIIGTHDNFFELGGHSLTAMQILSRVMKTLRVNVPLKCFYDSPTIAGLSDLIASRLLAETVEDTALFPELINTSIEANRRNEIFPRNSPIALSCVRVVARDQQPILPSIAQEPILRLARLFPDLHQFNISTAYRIWGPLSLFILEQSLTRLLNRHEALRTVFPVANGQHFQSIIESLPINFNIIDLYELPETERESKAKEFFAEESQRPFDLAHGPLFRVTVFRLSDNDHILAVTVHQVISDGWSMVIFFRDLAEFYCSRMQANQSQLPDLPIQYADFAVWQREALQAGLMDGQLSYWKRQLSEPLIPLKFSTDARQSDETNFFTARKNISISGKLYQSVKSLAREEKITPYLVLLSALNILLFRYLDQGDIRIGTLVANRHRSELENVIGHFVNTIILRTRVSERLNFKEFAQLIRDMTVSAHSNQDIPFEVLLRSYENASTIQCEMLSPVLFIFQGMPPPVILPNLTVSILDDFQSTMSPEVALTMFDLILSVKERSEGLAGFVVYKISVFDEMMVTRFMRNFQNLLERIVNEPNESVHAICSSVEI